MQIEKKTVQVSGKKEEETNDGNFVVNAFSIVENIAEFLRWLNVYRITLCIRNDRENIFIYLWKDDFTMKAHRKTES